MKFNVTNYSSKLQLLRWLFKITQTFQCQNFQSKSIVTARFVNLHRLINTVALRCSARPLALTAISPPSISWSYLLVSSFTDALHLLFGWKFLLNSKSPVMHFCKVKRFITGLLKFNRNLPLWNKKKKSGLMGPWAPSDGSC